MSRCHAGWFFTPLLSLIMTVSPAAASPGADASDVSLSDGSLQRLVLAGHDVLPDDARLPLWKLELIDTTSQQRVTVMSDTTEGIHARRAADASRGVVRWSLHDASGQRIGGVSCIARASGDVAGRAEFHFQIDALDERYVLDRVWYPMVPLRPISQDATRDTAVIPTTMGQQIEQIHEAERWTWPVGEHPFKAVARCRYPSKRGTLQMLCISGDRGTLLMMTPDEQRGLKELVIDRTGDGPTCLAAVHYPVASEPIRQPVKINYPVWLQWVDGDWYDAAQVYRDWALQQPWAQTKLGQRDDLPEWFATLPSWAKIPRDPSTTWQERTDWPLRLAEALGGPMGLHFYGWDEQGGPENLVWPQHFPPDPRVSELMDRYHDAGIKVMPFVNIRITSLDGPAWDRWQKVVVRGRDGELRDQQTWRSFGGADERDRAEAEGRRATPVKPGLWRIDYPFTTGDLGDARWRQAAWDRTVPLLLEHPFDMVYQDQLDSVALRCWDETHDHAPGAPNAWTDGLREHYAQVAEAFARANRKVPVIGEYINEAYMPHVHGALTVSRGELLRHRTVPLFQAVYHEHYATIGWADQYRGHLKHREGFFHQMAMNLGYGGQLGWLAYTASGLLDDPSPELDAMRQLVDVRRDHGPTLGYGKILRQPSVHDVDTRMAPDSEPAEDRMAWPAVLTGLLRHPNDHARGVVTLVNWTRSPQQGRVTFDLREFAGTPALRWSDGRDLEVQRDADQATATFDLPGSSVRVIVIGSE